ncbi:RNA methyltransferase [Candidatus Pacearchaeota archaeon]|jgi:tRNA G18 (ribose-2'-O)-methylase SpoU|nr:RNA methyltransferase [Candidatus Pacearchaeota archaeon]
MRGYFEIGIYHTKTEINVGTLWRSAYQLGAAGIFTIGRRYKRQAGDTVKAWRHIPLRHYVDFEDFNTHRPQDAVLIGVEMGGDLLHTCAHPDRAIYLMGAEDSGLPQQILDRCNRVIAVETSGVESYNVAVAGSIVMYHRFITRTCL